MLAYDHNTGKRIELVSRAEYHRRSQKRQQALYWARKLSEAYTEGRLKEMLEQHRRANDETV